MALIEKRRIFSFSARHQWFATPQFAGYGELIGGECKAPSTDGAVPPASIGNAAIAFERPAESAN